MKNLSDNLRRIRKENNLSQEAFAEKLGVSRQSVSKWENSEAYPEMDKMIKICELFNLNMDDLLNQNVKEVNSNKESKLNINKYIDNFLEFITKTIDMFTSMKFKDKIKCIFEQIVLVGIISIIFLIIGAVFSNIYSGLYGILPDALYYGLIRILKSIYLLLCLILGIILILHIFKVRYLDYYVIVKEELPKEIKQKDNEKVLKEEIKEEKVILDKPKEKIIIRDKKHSTYNFISGLLQCTLYILKVVAVLIGLSFIFSLIGLIILFVISFIFKDTFILFTGTLISLLGMIILNIIILILIYNFILSRKSKKNLIALSSLISIILIGAGIGIFSIGLTKLEFINTTDSKYYVKEEIKIDMNKDIFIEDYMNMNDIIYIESDNKDIKIEYIYHPLFDVKFNNRDNRLYFNHYVDDYNMSKVLKEIIKDINSEVVVNYSLFEIKVYTTKENIDILKSNLNKYYEEMNQEYFQREINEYEQRINDLQDLLEEKEYEIERLEDEIYMLEENSSYE